MIDSKRPPENHEASPIKNQKTAIGGGDDAQGGRGKNSFNRLVVDYH